MVRVEPPTVRLSGCNKHLSVSLHYAEGVGFDKHPYNVRKGVRVLEKAGDSNGKQPCDVRRGVLKATAPADPRANKVRKSVRFAPQATIALIHEIPGRNTVVYKTEKERIEAYLAAWRSPCDDDSSQAEAEAAGMSAAKDAALSKIVAAAREMERKEQEARQEKLQAYKIYQKQALDELEIKRQEEKLQTKQFLKGREDSKKKLQQLKARLDELQRLKEKDWDELTEEDEAQLEGEVDLRLTIEALEKSI